MSSNRRVGTLTLGGVQFLVEQYPEILTRF